MESVDKEYDSFELLYVYIHKIDRCFENVDFLFTTEYDIKFNEQEKKLDIRKLDNNYLKGFYGDKISSINLIVGKNGAGKTTLFDLLGLHLDDRRKSFDIEDDDEYGWFALYRTNIENKFYIEGNNHKILPCEFYSDFPKYEQVKPFYAFVFQYDFEKEKITKSDFASKVYFDEYPFIFYNRNNLTSYFIKNNKSLSNDDYTYGLYREYIKANRFSDLYYLATHEKKFFKLVTNDFISISITIDEYSHHSIDDYDEFSELFDELKEKTSYKESDVKFKIKFRLLSNEILDLYYLIIKNTEARNSFIHEIDVIKQKDDIGEVIKELYDVSCQYSNRIERYSCGKYEELYDFCESILQLPNDCFINSIKDEREDMFKISINLNNKYNEKIHAFLQLYDEGKYFASKEELYPSYWLYVEMQLNNGNISEGELNLIQTYAGIYFALSKQGEKQKSAIIILDEPDKSFHPSWIACFINDLIEMINSMKNDVVYQVLISTHSPFMLSDIPKECVTCIDIENHKRIVKKAGKSFASNFYDIIDEAFFLDSPIGKFAESKINDIIEDIVGLEHCKFSKDTKKRISELEKRIQIIDDDYLKYTLQKQLIDKVAIIDMNYSLELEKGNLENRLKSINEQLEGHNDTTR